MLEAFFFFMGVHVFWTISRLSLWTLFWDFLLELCNFLLRLCFWDCLLKLLFETVLSRLPSETFFKTLFQDCLLRLSLETPFGDSLLKLFLRLPLETLFQDFKTSPELVSYQTTFWYSWVELAQVPPPLDKMNHFALLFQHLLYVTNFRQGCNLLQLVPVEGAGNLLPIQVFHPVHCRVYPDDLCHHENLQCPVRLLTSVGDQCVLAQLDLVESTICMIFQ